MRVEIPIANGFYISESLPISHQQCVNFIPVTQQQPSLSQSQLFGSPGIEYITTSGETSADANRGAHVMAGLAYFVNGEALYLLQRTIVGGAENFEMVYLGVIDGTSRVSMADNGSQLMIMVPGGPGYIYDLNAGPSLVEITAPGFTANGDPQYVVFIDGYFACNTDSKKWIVSNLNDGTAWDALDFGSAEADPDPIVAPIVHNNQIYLLGSETTEGFQNIGGAGFPFQRSNVFLDKGCYSPFTLISTNQQFFFVGGGVNERAAIWSFSGGSYTKISTIVIDSILAGYTDAVLNAAFSMSWANRGQFLVSFTFQDRCFVYNMTTQKWHEQASGIADEYGDLQQERWRVNSIITAYGYTLVGDSQDGRVGKLDSGTYQEYGTDIVRVFSTQPIANQGMPFRWPKIELTLEAGIGNGVAEPIVSMAISEDGKTFAYERNRKIGAIGKYGQRAIWRKNGRVPRYAVLLFRVSDPIKPVIIKLEADIV